MNNDIYSIFMDFYLAVPRLPSLYLS